MKLKLPKITKLPRWLKNRLYVPTITYFKESAKELGKVNWPDRKQALRLTTAVFVFSTGLAIFISVMDVGLNSLVQHFIINH